MHSTRVIGENKEVFYINCRSQVHCGRSISLFKIKTKHCSLSKNKASTGYSHSIKIGQNDISFFFNINFKILIRCSTLTCNISKLQFYSLYTAQHTDPPPASPSVCSCVTESVTPQQEVKGGELQAGRERRGKLQKYSTDSCLTLDGGNAKMCDTAKRRHREERKKEKRSVCDRV